MRQAALGILMIVVIAAIAAILYHHQPPLASTDVEQPDVASALPTTGQIQPPPGREPPGMPPGGGPGGGFRFGSPPLLEALDANRDGELDGAELAGAASRVKTLDKNGDGEVAADEFGSFGGRGGPGGRRGPGFGGFGGPGGPGGGPGFGGPGGPSPGGPGPGGGRRTMEIVSRFDEDKDGMLDRQERVKARAFVKEQGVQRGPGGPFGGRGPGGREEAAAPKPGKRLSPEDVTRYPDAGLYDPRVIRTLFFVFDSDDWEVEMEEFRGTDVEVPAELIVDGNRYPNVGVRYRGNTSMHTVSRGKKRPLNVSIDLVDTKQQLLGHRTLNLLNSFMDPSFLRVVLFDQIAGQYLPTTRANLVRVVINGESWGVYVNEEQFNRDFASHWFGEADGARWRAPVNFSGGSALVYHGENEETYHRLYELKARDEKQAWHDLIELCRQLDQLPDDKLEQGLHATFKVSQGGETVLLVDSQARGSAILDAVEFGPQRADVSWGRHPDGAGKWQMLPPTPGRPNSDH